MFLYFIVPGLRVVICSVSNCRRSSVALFAQPGNPVTLDYVRLCDVMLLD